MPRVHVLHAQPAHRLSLASGGVAPASINNLWLRITVPWGESMCSQNHTVVVVGERKSRDFVVILSGAAQRETPSETVYLKCVSLHQGTGVTHENFSASS